MSEFSVRSDSVDVEQIMRQIRARIREKRGADYTEAELQKLASVKLETFLDPRGLRSDLVQQFRARLANESSQDEFTEAMLYETHRPLLRKIRRWLNPVLKLFINPAAVSGAIQGQSKRQSDVLFYEVIHNLVIEVTRLGIEVHNLKMRVESMSSRLDFDERRARSLEGSVQYRPPRQERPRPAAPPPAPAGPSIGVSYGTVVSEPPAAAPAPGGPRESVVGPGRPDVQNGGERPDGGRRRRRRRRRRPGSNLAGAPGGMGSPGAGAPTGGAASPEPAGGDDLDGDMGPDDGADGQ